MKKVLVIDDKKDLANVTKLYLEKEEDCLVDLASNPEEAYSFLSSKKYDFVFVDLDLQRTINGKDVIQLFHYMIDRNTKIYLFTNHDTDYVKEKIAGFENLFLGIIRKMEMKNDFRKAFERTDG